MLTISAFINEIDEMQIARGFASSVAEASTSISFNSINAQNIDFTNGRLVFDLTGLGDQSDAWDSLFGTLQDGIHSLFDNASGLENLYTFTVVASEGALGDDLSRGLELFALINGGLLDDDTWRIELTAGGFTAVNTLIEAALIPEPATLVIMGLGLAGLGYARRRNLRIANAA